MKSEEIPFSYNNPIGEGLGFCSCFWLSGLCCASVATYLPLPDMSTCEKCLGVLEALSLCLHG